MARYGARITNRATGAIQIDDLYGNLALVQKTTITTGAVMANSTMSEATIDITSVGIPIVAFSCTVPAVAPSISKPSTNVWRYRFMAEGASRSITVYVFSDPPDLGPGWGVRIKSGGVVRYDSRHRYVRRVAYARGTFNTSSAVNTAGPSASYAAGKTYAVIAGRSATRYSRQYVSASPGFTIQETRALAIALNGTSLTSKWLVTFGQQINGPPIGTGANIVTTQPNYSWAVIDVTGY